MKWGWWIKYCAMQLWIHLNLSNDVAVDDDIYRRRNLFEMSLLADRANKTSMKPITYKTKTFVWFSISKTDGTIQWKLSIILIVFSQTATTNGHFFQYSRKHLLTPWVYVYVLIRGNLHPPHEFFVDKGWKNINLRSLQKIKFPAKRESYLKWYESYCS